MNPSSTMKWLASSMGSASPALPAAFQADRKSSDCFLNDADSAAPQATTRGVGAGRTWNSGLTRSIS